VPNLGAFFAEGWQSGTKNSLSRITWRREWDSITAISSKSR
jgi:hypothetical protein